MHRTLERNADTIIFIASMALVVSSGLSIMWAISNGKAVIKNVDETFLTSFLTSFTVDVINLGVAVKLGIRDNMIHYLLRSLRSGKLSKKETQGTNDAITESKKARKTLIFSYLLVGALSICCNILYAHYKIPDNDFLAVLVGTMPFVLISICTIVLRAIPLNYQQLAHEVINEAQIAIVKAAQHYVVHFYKIKNPTEAQKQLFVAATNTLALLVDPTEAQQFKSVAASMGGVPQLAAPQTEAIDVTSEDVLNAQDVADKLKIPLRTAQYHLQRFDKSVKIGASFYVKAEDLPELRAKLRKPRAKELAPPVASEADTQSETQDNASLTPLDAIEAQVTIQPA